MDTRNSVSNLIGLLRSDTNNHTLPGHLTAS